MVKRGHVYCGYNCVSFNEELKACSHPIYYFTTLGIL